MSNIHPTAIIEDGAQIEADVLIGPYCCIGSNVTLASEIKLESHVVISGLTSIGKGTHVFPFASIGSNPQDLKYNGEESRLDIGINNIIREYVTINPGTEGGGLVTKVGDNCLLMMSSHVAHDCCVGDNVILVNNATLGGHVNIGDFAIVGGLSAVHQFVRIGRHAMIGGCSGVENDVIPYGSIVGNRAHLSGLNLVGLKRRGFSRDIIHDLRRAYRLLFSQEGTQAERMADVLELFPDIEPVIEIVEFMNAQSSRSICQPLIEDAA
jgi:UDP-N-acetylglucosamine acyltransferase